jgi:enamine deaminase RidA (YjgF/YER057c/UK114 family)
MKTKFIAAAAATAIAVLMAADASAAKVERVSGGKPGTSTADWVSVGQLVFPSAVAGTHGDALAQVDEIVQRLHDRLAKRGLGIGSMIQHTIFLKNGAADPIKILTRFHEDARRLAPNLEDKPSVGTIIRVPGFADPNTLVLIDSVAAAPAVKGAPDDFKRVLFTFGPKEIAESLGVGNLVFSAGMEAMDFEHGTLPSGIDAQIEAVVRKYDAALKKGGVGLANVVSHNLYVTKGSDPMHVIQKFNELARRYAPQMQQTPGVGALAVVDGMAADGFLLESDAIAARPPDNYARVPFDVPMDIVKSVAVGDLVFVAGINAMDLKTHVAPSDAAAQVEVAVNSIDATLRKSGLSIGDVIKQRLFVKTGTDVEQVRKTFHDAAARLAPQLRKHPAAETVVVVEGFEADALQFEASVIAARPK